MNIPTWLSAAFLIVPAMATPILSVLTSGAPIDLRSVLTMIVGAFVAGLLALKGFYSTTYADKLYSSRPMNAPLPKG